MVALNDYQIKHMVDRFLRWRLPENFSPDCGISFQRTYNEHTDHPGKFEPVGTNLLDAMQATEMVRHMIEGLPAAPVQPVAGEQPWRDVTKDIVARFEVAAAVNGSAVWNAEGSAACAKIIKEMATKLDTAIEDLTRQRDRWSRATEVAEERAEKLLEWAEKSASRRVDAECKWQRDALALSAFEARALAAEKERDALKGELARVRQDREYIIGFNAGWDEAFTSLKFPTMLRKMWSGGEVQAWLDEQRERDAALSQEKKDG